MLNGKKIVVLQNTHYHFETALSIYQSLKDAGAEVFLHRFCDDRFGQEFFVDHLGLKKATQSDLEEAACGFVVSAYPNPYITIPNAIPNRDNPAIQMFGKRLVYLSHRFGRSDDYNNRASPVRPHNCLCLSPLSSRIGIDHFHPIDMPIKPERRPFVKPLQFVVQGHFELKNRNMPDWTFSLEDGSKRSSVVFLGGLSKPEMRPESDRQGFVFLTNQQESSFYKFLNRHTNFILTMIDESIKDGTYLKERFSSNFNQAFALEKPIVCREEFKEIYKTPGIYYNESNAKEVIERIFEMSQAEYESMVDEFKTVKAPMREHNSRILTTKVEAVCG